MKHNIDRMKFRIKHMSKRSLAMMLCFLILLTAIGAGSVLNVIAQSRAENTSEQLSQGAAGNNSDGSLSEDDDSGTLNDSDIALTRKGDSDLAGTSWGNNDKLHIQYDSTWHDIVVDSDDGEAEFTLSSQSNIEFEINLNGDVYKKASSASNFSVDEFSSSTYSGYHYAKNSGDDRTTFTTNNLPAGTYYIKIDTDQAGTIKLSVKKKVSNRTIAYNSPSNGSYADGSPTSANAGSSVSITAVPNTGYVVNSFSVTDSDSGSVATTNVGNVYTFTMPDKNVSVAVSFALADYNVTHTSSSEYTVTGLSNPYKYGDTVSFTVTPAVDYRITGVSAAGVSITESSGTYSFTMPARNVALSISYASTSASTSIYFKSATAWVYQPYITVNDGVETKMTFDRALTYTGMHHTAPLSSTGSLKFGWYKVDLVGVDVSRPVKIVIRSEDTWMTGATGTFTISAGQDVYLACDNISDGNTLVDLTKYSAAGSTPNANVLDFYDTPLHMVATSGEIAALTS